MSTIEPTVIFDGECVLCNAAIARLIKIDKRGVFRVCGSESEVGKELIRQSGLPIDITKTSVVVVTDQRAYTHSSAIFFILGQLQLPWALLSLGRLVPTSLSDTVYRFISKHRKRFTNADPVCGVPPAPLRDVWMSRLAATVASDEKVFPIRISWSLLVPAFLFGVTRSRSYVRVTENRLIVRYGFVWLETSLDNITCAKHTGRYSWSKVFGIRESWVDHGLSFCGTTDGGVCICFGEKVAALGPSKRHPGLTVTVDDEKGLISLIDPALKQG